MRLLPDILGEQRQDDRLFLDLRVPADLDFFEGHFHGLPILPGVVQLDWCVRLARERIGLSGEFTCAENLKFLSIVRPGALLRLKLELRATRLSFEFTEAARKVSSGTLVFGAA